MRGHVLFKLYLSLYEWVLGTEETKRVQKHSNTEAKNSTKNDGPNSKRQRIEEKVSKSIVDVATPLHQLILCRRHPNLRKYQIMVCKYPHIYAIYQRLEIIQEKFCVNSGSILMKIV